MNNMLLVSLSLLLIRYDNYWFDNDDFFMTITVTGLVSLSIVICNELKKSFTEKSNLT